MPKCKTCGQDVVLVVEVLDALGNTVAVGDTVLYLRPITEVEVGPATIKANGYFGSEPILIEITSISLNTWPPRVGTSKEPNWFMMIGNHKKNVTNVKIKGAAGTPQKFIYKIR